MTDYTLSQRAEADLLDILAYGYRQFGVQQGDTYAAGLDSVFQLLAENPRLGRKADGIRPGVRRHEHASHVILYETISTGVLILAVVHGRSITRLAWPSI